MLDANVGEYQQPKLDMPPLWLTISCTTILSAALLAPYGALPLFSTGYYKLVAASIQWLHFCAGLGAIFLIVGILTSPRGVWPAVLNPTTILISAFAILTAIPMLHADHTGLVLFGSPQSGKGVIWFLDTAIFVALAYIIRDNKPAVAIVFLTALLATTPVVAQQFYNTHIRQTEFLLRGGDSYAYLGLLLPFLALMIDSGPLRRWGAAAAWLVSVSIIAVSGNKAAAGIFIVFAIVYGLTHIKPPLMLWARKINFWFAYVSIVVGVLLVGYLVLSINFRGTFDSIDSRVLIAKIGAAAQMEASTLQWAIGHGWGHTQGAFYRNLTESGVSLLDNRWDFLWRDIFHSHNIVQELVYEVGISGFTAFCALLAALIAYSAPSKRTTTIIFVAGYLLINSVWFEFAHTLPMLALTVFALISDRCASVPTRKVHRAFGFVIVTTAAISCVTASISLHRFDHQVKQFKMEGGPLTGKDHILARTDYPTANFPIDPRGDDFIRAAVYREIIRLINANQQTNTGYITPFNVVSDILVDIENRLASTTDPELILVGLAIFNDAYFDQNRSWLRPILVDRDQLWYRLANRHLSLAPKRTDVLVAYLSWLVTNGNFHQASELVETIARFNVDDPVRLYFKGVIDTANTTPKIKELGLRYIARAIDQGVERFLLVPGWLKKLAEQAKP